jgi:amidohydrolase
MVAAKIVGDLMRSFILAALLLSAKPAFALDPPADRTRIEASVEKAYPRLEAIFKDIHQHPETAFQETRTAALLAREMRKLGFDVTEKVGRTGVVAVLKNGDGPTVMVRTELDALPLEDRSGVPYASRAKQMVNGSETFVHHACGHDAHMAWWLGAAGTLAQAKDRWRGTVVFIAQPAEETLAGAKAMLADGLFTRFPKPDYAFAAHTTLEAAGSIMVKDGVASSASDALMLTFHGQGAHGSTPHRSIDPVVMGAHFVSDLQSVVSREINPNAFAVATVGSFQAGKVGNVIPDRAELRLSLRSYDPEVRAKLRAGVERTAKAAADMAGAPPPTLEVLGGTSAMRNDSALVARLTPTVLAAFPNARFEPASAPGYSASEDFAAFMEAGVPSIYYWIGGMDPALAASGKPLPAGHSPEFALAPGPAIRAGALLLALSVLAVAPAP